MFIIFFSFFQQRTIIPILIILLHIGKKINQSQIPIIKEVILSLKLTFSTQISSMSTYLKKLSNMPPDTTSRILKSITRN